MERTAKLTISSPLKKRTIAEMEEGYRALAGEQKQLAAKASAVEHEVVPEWK